VSFIVGYPRLFSMANNHDVSAEEMRVDGSNGGFLEGVISLYGRPIFLTVYWKIWKALPGIKKMIGGLGSWRK